MKTAILNAVFDLEGAFSPIVRDKNLTGWYSEIFNNTEIIDPDFSSDADYWIFVKKGVLVPSESNVELVEELLEKVKLCGSVTVNSGNVVICSKEYKDKPSDSLNVEVELLPYGNFTTLENRIVNIQLKKLFEKGCKVENFNNFFLSEKAVTGKNIFIGSGVVIKGDTTIGDDVHIGSNSLLEDSSVGNGCTILHGSVVKESKLLENVSIGPYTHLRTGVLMGKNAKAGNFVEMKKTDFGESSKAMHLAYLGDADIGERVNIGAGTITCNYDGRNKNRTDIRDGVFVGSDSQLVAPVKLEANSYIAAGSTVTEDVSAGALCISRVKQREIPGWFERKKLKD